MRPASVPPVRHQTVRSRGDSPLKYPSAAVPVALDRSILRPTRTPIAPPSRPIAPTLSSIPVERKPPPDPALFFRPCSASSMPFLLPRYRTWTSMCYAVLAWHSNVKISFSSISPIHDSRCFLYLKALRAIAPLQRDRFTVQQGIRQNAAGGSASRATA